MPNWCSTDIRIVCKKEEYAKEIFKKLCEWYDSDIEADTSDFKRGWLGRFLIQAGITTREDIDSCKIRCRGYVTYMDISQEEINLQTETAWEPMLKMWKLIIEKFWKNMVDNIYYVAQEPGCGLYWSNDSYLEYAALSDDLCLTDYEASENEALSYMHRLFDKYGISTDKQDFKSLYEEIQYLEFDFELFKYEHIDIDDLN